MIVTIAGGRPAPTLTCNPLEAHADDDRLHRRRPAPATSRSASLDYKTSSRSASLLFVFTFALNAAQHPPGAQVPGGVRMTRHRCRAHRGSARAGRCAGTPARPLPARPLFKLALQACLLVGVVVPGRAAGLRRLSRAGRGWTLGCGRTCRPAVRPGRPAGVQSAITGTLWVIGLTALICLPTGILAGDLPGGVRRPRPAGRTGCSSSTSRTSPACRRSSSASSAWASSPAVSASGSPCITGGDHAVPAGAAGRHHRDPRGDPGGAAVDPPRLASAGRDASGRPSGGRCCRPRCPASPPARSWRCPGRSARPPRCCCSARSPSSRSTRTALLSQYTVLPIQIYDCIKQSREEFQAAGRRRRSSCCW